MTGGFGVLLHAIILASALAISHSLLKFAAAKDHPTFLALVHGEWAYIATALVLYGFIFGYYLAILRFTNLSFIYPVYTGLSVLAVVLTGRLVFDESFSAIQWIGALFIIFGVIIVGVANEASG